ncbi:zinc transporter ZIP13 homolog [Diprion similis]|uniref:zinc transporter ZIP13 homolog n=1 Tax=Diprion similis TaxID=362088 RepID=UPI001EF8EA97|nr:zinc transporter ZIP13 homolog [Diprion similis]
MATLGGNMATMCAENCTDGGILYELVSEEIWAPWNAALSYFEYQPWFFSLLGSLMVGLSGVLPLLVIPIDHGIDLKHGESAGTLNVLLSFAVGGLLGDVFLHLLPEAWANKALNQWSKEGHASMACGLWVLAGFLVFVIAEKIFGGLAQNGDDEEDDDDEEEEDAVNVDVDDNIGLSESINRNKIKQLELLNNNNFQKELENNNCLMSNGNVKNGCVRLSAQIMNGIPKDILSLNGGCCNMSNSCKNGLNAKLSNGFISNHSDYANSVKVSTELKNGLATKGTNGYVEMTDQPTNITKDSSREIIAAKKIAKKEKAKHISGYLNLLANSIDNFTHGLAVGGAFLVSFRLGALTTLAILVHEIPHEVGDFAILLRSGFNRWDAAKAQLLTAGGGIFGALVAVLCSGGGVEARTSWILPFTAGGFLHIGLVTVLPELLQETNPKESLKQLAALLLGITLMAFMTAICD